MYSIQTSRCGIELLLIHGRPQLQWKALFHTFVLPKGGIVVEPVIVGVIGKARIESYLFWGANAVESRKEFEIHHVVVVPEPGHRGERTVEGVAKSVAGSLDERLRPQNYSRDLYGLGSSYRMTAHVNVAIFRSPPS